ncbi:hypothetical protein C8D92_101204 [Tamilnaduibacter salinus]|uniref:UDP pyrophosphate phosphatase n=2 Tax=Tamilnaduibacter salinus TaxID=1484056 RepID=A0A2A2I711_9GAMM|nr:UDP pyrophosphate phosphatase [Tamilnaduibacter salinus]PAV27168.1 UDP pyrophosphate phosphatase [Tamilnaduibacter salinus]PVY78998.1 hypothetical protein C8D92_101204 [Tamilnaduibacter salinus]
MIGGVGNNNGVGLLQPERPIQRDTSQNTRPTGDRNESGRNTRAIVDGEVQTNRIDPERLERRVQARQAAEDARLERFRADDLPLSTSRALDAFSGVASQRDDGESDQLTGIDIRV